MTALTEDHSYTIMETVQASDVVKGASSKPSAILVPLTPSPTSGGPSLPAARMARRSSRVRSPR